MKKHPTSFFRTRPGFQNRLHVEVPIVIRRRGSLLPAFPRQTDNGNDGADDDDAADGRNGDAGDHDL